MCNLYFRCDRGAAGDMITAALMELIPDQKKTLDRLNHIGIPGVEFIFEKKEKYGMAGNGMTVRVHGNTEEEAEDRDHHDHHHDHNNGHHGDHHHVHMTLDEIYKIVDHISASEKVKRDVKNIYKILADAESNAHQCLVSEVHFHEVGALDAIADITAVCMLIEELGPKKIFSSKIHVGNGSVKCAHGILPIPAPATANILADIPYEHGDIEGEACTPTAAALLKYFVNEHMQDVPEKKPDSEIGIGFGKKDFSIPSYFAAWQI